jgi:hypothetical protein
MAGRRDAPRRRAVPVVASVPRPLAPLRMPLQSALGRAVRAVPMRSVTDGAA